jgi:hypothetical protein
MRPLTPLELATLAAQLYDPKTESDSVGIIRAAQLYAQACAITEPLTDPAQTAYRIAREVEDSFRVPPLTSTPPAP